MRRRWHTKTSQRIRARLLTHARTAARMLHAGSTAPLLTPPTSNLPSPLPSPGPGLALGPSLPCDVVLTAETSRQESPATAVCRTSGRFQSSTATTVVRYEGLKVRLPRRRLTLRDLVYHRQMVPAPAGDLSCESPRIIGPSAISRRRPDSSTEGMYRGQQAPVRADRPPQKNG